MKRADEDEENAGERIERQILDSSDIEYESEVSFEEEEASEAQLVPFTEDEKSIPDVGEFQEPDRKILDAFPAPPNLPVPLKSGKFLTNKIIVFHRRKIMIPKLFQAPAQMLNLMPKETLKMRNPLPTRSCRVNTQEKLLNTALNSKLRIPYGYSSDRFQVKKVKINEKMASMRTALLFMKFFG